MQQLEEEDLEERVTRETASSEASPDLVPILGANLRRLRVKRGLSLERLAKQSGVSRAMLSQVELGYSAPTINVVWRIAHALNVSFGALITAPETPTTHVLRKAQTRTLTSHDGAFKSRALFPYNGPRPSEFYELRIAGGAIERAAPHPPGTCENLVVASGRLHVHIADEIARLENGDAVQFAADIQHAYENPDETETVAYLVMTYAEQVSD
jgi:transcriptional regulator with XRE-family HTH domain